jgi:L-idonate 5-dehydrogenase
MNTRNIAATLFAAQDLRITEQSLNPLSPGMVRVRFGAGSICGSDLHYFSHGRTGDFVVSSPLILGHEIAGEIVEVNGAVKGLQPGDRVAVNPSRWCGVCAYCREGRPNLCQNIYFMGSASKIPHMQGGFASLFDATPEQCVRVPANVPFSSLALAEPLSIGLHAVARAGRVKGAHLAIFGAGPIGLFILLAAQLAGAAEVTIIDIAPAPLRFAKQLGAKRVVDVSGGEAELSAIAQNNPFDVAFEVSGTPAGLASALGAVKRGGIVVQVGNQPAGQVPFPANKVMSKELDLRGVFRCGYEYQAAVEAIAAGKVNVESIVTARRPLAGAPDAFRLALDRSQSVKVVLTAE